MIELSKIPKDIRSIFTMLESSRAICVNAYESVDTVNETLDNFKEATSMICSGLDFLGIMPEDTDTEESINHTVNTLKEKINEPLSTLKSSIKSVSEYVTTLYDYMEKSVNEVYEYIENIETVIMSTVNKYLNIIQNAINNINCYIRKLNNIVNSVVYNISLMPTMMLNNLMSDIRYSFDKKHKKNKIVSKLLEPVINNALSSVTNKMMEPLTGITSSFNRISNDMGNFTSVISSKIGNAYGYLIWRGR